MIEQITSGSLKERTVRILTRPTPSTFKAQLNISLIRPDDSFSSPLGFHPGIIHPIRISRFSIHKLELQTYPGTKVNFITPVACLDAGLDKFTEKV